MGVVSRRRVWMESMGVAHNVLYAMKHTKPAMDISCMPSRGGV